MNAHKLTFDYKNAKSEDIVVYTKFLSSFVCNNIMEAVEQTDADESASEEDKHNIREALNAKYASCIFSGLSPKLRTCFAPVKNLFAPSLDEDDANVLNNCFADPEMQQEIKTLSESARKFPERSKYIHMANTLQGKEILANYNAANKSNEDETALMPVKCISSWDTCEQEMNAFYTCMNGAQDPTKCFREAVNYDHCFTSATCFEPLKACMQEEKTVASIKKNNMTEEEMFFKCADAHPSVRKCVSTADQINSKMRAEYEKQAMQQRMKQEIPTIAQTAPDALSMSQDQYGARLTKVMHETCGHENNLFNMCRSQRENCEFEGDMLGLCVFSNLCAKQLNACVQRGTPFAQCFNEEMVRKCIQRSEEVEKQ